MAGNNVFKIETTLVGEPDIKHCASAVLATNLGEYVTAAHAVLPPKQAGNPSAYLPETTLITDNGTIKCKIKIVDPTYDVAIITPEFPTKQNPQYAHTVDGQTLKYGDKVSVFGFPKDFASCQQNNGQVIGLRRETIIDFKANNMNPEQGHNLCQLLGSKGHLPAEQCVEIVESEDKLSIISNTEMPDLIKELGSIGINQIRRRTIEETSAPTVPGQSGGALMTGDGKVAAFVLGTLPERNRSLFVLSETARELYRKGTDANIQYEHHTFQNYAFGLPFGTATDKLVPTKQSADYLKKLSEQIPYLGGKFE